MIRLTSGILNCRENVLSLEIGIVSQNLRHSCFSAEQLQNVCDADSYTANTGAPAAQSIVDRGSSYRIHIREFDRLATLEA